jgi:hypothetical protein
MQPLITPTSMSRDHHPLQLAIEDNKNPGSWADLFRKPSQPEFDGYLTHSSSPARSSSPPSTPYSSRRDSGYAYIRSSPDVAVDALYRQHAVDIWGRPALSSKSLFSSPYAGGSSSYSHRYAPGYGFQEHTYSQFLDSNGPRNHILSDSEEDMEDISRVTSDDSSYRTTFFRVSAERGLWRGDPIPLMKTTTSSTVQQRKSVPAVSRVPTPLPLTIRTVSEPAPSNNSQMTGFYPEKENGRAAAPSDSVMADTAVQPTRFTPSIDSKPEDEISSPHTLPSLIADAESEGDVNIELDALGVPSSPLPPSSPPLSPLSQSISIISRSSSPLSFAFEGSSSPLSELPDDYDNDESHLEESFALDNALGMQNMIVSSVYFVAKLFLTTLELGFRVRLCKQRMIQRIRSMHRNSKPYVMIMHGRNRICPRLSPNCHLYPVWMILFLSHPHPSPLFRMSHLLPSHAKI